MRNLYSFKHVRRALATVCCAATLFSCTDWDEFKNYTKDGEIQYTGKLDSVKVYSGKGRVLLSGITKSDPKIKKAKIFWNDRKDSLVFDLDASAGSQQIQKTFAVDEGVKSFMVFTYDGAGNPSVGVNAVGTSYGNSYRRKIGNRLISSLTFEPTRTIINWEQMDLSTGAQYTEVEYTLNGQTRKLVTPATEASTALDGFVTSANIKYRTIFKPEKTSIDTFAVAFRDHYVKIVPQLKNRQVPFIASARSGRWGNLADWQSNANVRNHGGYGGWDEWNNNIFNVESGWGSPHVTNGKIWQTLTLDPGNYTFEISDLRDTNLSENDNAFLVVADGNALPDVEQVATSKGYVKITGQKPVSQLKVNFTVTQKGPVSMGFLTTQLGDRYCNIRAFNFYER